MLEIKAHVLLKVEGLNITLYPGYSVYTKFSPLEPDLGCLCLPGFRRLFT